ncbi:Cytidine and dCMP deaminase domain-containing protein 1 [Entophlyctis luteolus]|nr:Cytidine and dCMP deaminase domain-containing protein 1 [Entophlyctis luteolus]
MEKYPMDPPVLPPPEAEFFIMPSPPRAPTSQGQPENAPSLASPLVSPTLAPATGPVASSHAALRTGAVLVDGQDRVVSIERTGEAHAAVRCILFATTEVKGCDLYISRFPCALCMKIAVQAGVRKIYYFPAEKWELAASDDEKTFSLGDQIYSFELREKDRAEQNRRAVLRLGLNNAIALTLFIPQWDHGDVEENVSIPAKPWDGSRSPSSKRQRISGEVKLYTWPLDPNLEQSSPAIARRLPIIVQKFSRTCAALNAVAKRYNVGILTFDAWKERHMASVATTPIRNSKSEISDTTNARTVNTQVPFWAHHAMVLAHIAAKRTDDMKLGVGSVLVDKTGKYFSVGWNGYPKKSQHLDYPRGGADDSMEFEELKYDYILHSEQNALLWRNPQGVHCTDGFVVATKMPCDECSPMLHDAGLRRCITVPQHAKDAGDRTRLRGLRYTRVAALMDELLVFDV